MIRAKR